MTAKGPDTMQELVADRLAIHPLTPDRWDDLERLFGERGVGNRTGRRSARSSNRDRPPGCWPMSMVNPPVGPRESYPVLGRPRVLKPVDDQPVWAMTCFFVAKPYRRQGISSALPRAAVEFAAEHGATIVEGYPVDPTGADQPPILINTGLTLTSQGAGFCEAVRRSKKRPLMRYAVTDSMRGK